MIRTLKSIGSLFPYISKCKFSGTITTATNEVYKLYIFKDVLKVLHSESRDIFRNVAIIAHVDHGKTVNIYI